MKKYGNLDGLRTVAALGVVLMHVRANIGYEIVVDGGTEYLMNNLIPQFSTFVHLFLIISGFAMCCGYYEKIRNGKIFLDEFYKKRYTRIFPFFALLVFMDLGVKYVLDGGIVARDVYEAFADLTLLFGFLPASNISVIGVGWTLGVIFGFYILFPFFVYMIWNKKRAWLWFAISIGLNFICSTYFVSEGRVVLCNVPRCLCYFVAGGLIYLYKTEIEGIVRNVGIGICISIIGLCIVFFIPSQYGELVGVIFALLKTVIGFSAVVCGALCPDAKIWKNGFTSLISKYSLEIYLSHMMIFRVLEKVGVLSIAGKNAVSVMLTFVFTVLGVVLFAVTYNVCERQIRAKYNIWRLS